MLSVEDKIFSHLKKCGRGTFCYAADLIRYGEQKAIAKALERMTHSGKLLRICRGMYYYPRIDKVLGLGVLYPTLEEIAQNLAKRDKARIIPTGIYALNRLGFSTQIPMNVVFLTDGYNRKVTLYNGGTIQFRRTATKNLAFNSRLAMLLTFAYKELGKENITDEIKLKTKQLLAQDEHEVVKQDYKLMPAWVSSIIKSLYEE